MTDGERLIPGPLLLLLMALLALSGCGCVILGQFVDCPNVAKKDK